MRQNKSGQELEIQKPESYQRHRRQSFWQIVAPILLIGLMVLVAVVFMILTISGVQTGIAVSQWSDLSIIWLLMPLIFPAVMVVILLFFMIYGIVKLRQILPVYTRLIQSYSLLFGLRVEQVSKRALSPVINLKSSLTGVGALFLSLFRRSRG